MSDNMTLPGSAGKTEDDEVIYASRIDDLKGKTIAYIDWGKPNGEELYENFRELFSDEFGVKSLEYFRKPSPASPIPDELLQKILKVDPDGVVIAIADCGSCNSTSVVDAITFEERNIPSVQIITDAFLDLNGKISESHGYEHLPLIAVNHPTRYLDEEEVHEMAVNIMWTVHTSLTCEECLAAEINATEEVE